MLLPEDPTPRLVQLNGSFTRSPWTNSSKRQLPQFPPVCLKYKCCLSIAWLSLVKPKPSVRSPAQNHHWWMYSRQAPLQPERKCSDVPPDLLSGSRLSVQTKGSQVGNQLSASGGALNATQGMLPAGTKPGSYRKPHQSAPSVFSHYSPPRIQNLAPFSSPACVQASVALEAARLFNSNLSRLTE